MRATTIGLAATALLSSGCIVREIHEIHHVRDGGNRAPGATGATGSADGATCDGCDDGAAPGAVMADSQPPPPMVEEPLDQPAEGYVWVNGYWHWNGVEWVWMSGDWVPPVDGSVYLPPAYYATGAHCLYVPGRWGRGPRGRTVRVRDHRTRKDPRLPDGRGVRDHRTDVADRDDKDDRRPGRRGVRDHRTEKPGDPDVDRETRPDVVIRGTRRYRVAPAPLAPDLGPDRGPDRGRDRDPDRSEPGGRGVDVVDAGGVEAGTRVIAPGTADNIGDLGGADRGQGGDRAGVRQRRDFVIVRPVGPIGPDSDGRGRGVARKGPSRVDRVQGGIAPAREPPAVHRHGYRTHSIAPGTRLTPPSRGPERVGPPVRVTPPARMVAPANRQPAAGQPPASGNNSAGRARHTQPGPPPRATPRRR